MAITVPTGSFFNSYRNQFWYFLQKAVLLTLPLFSLQRNQKSNLIFKMKGGYG